MSDLCQQKKNKGAVYIIIIIEIFQISLACHKVYLRFQGKKQKTKTFLFL